MAGTTRQSTVQIADELFDKYTLPKVALAIILVASFVGTAVTVRLTGYWLLAATTAKWGFLVALGVLTGGLLWKHAFVRPRDLAADAYCGRMYHRFDRITLGALAVLALGGTVVVRQYVRSGHDTVLVAALGATLLALVGTAGVQALRTAPVDEQFRHPLGVAALALSVLAVGLVATAEVALRAGDAAAVGVRTLHLLAFSVWVGGAVWNIFVAVPTGKEHPTTAVVRAAGQQLERFRWAVRFVIPTIALTGVYQAVDALGYSTAAYLESLVGLAVVSKLGLVGVLVVIFTLCPMWRACSPIDGVCDLADLGDDGDATPSDSCGTEDAR